MRRLLFLLLLLPLSSAPLAAPIGVAASILPQRYLLQAIGGDHVAVQVMVRPGFEPATYEPTPRQLTALTATRLYFAIGVPFERAWLPRFKSANPKLRVIDTARGIRRTAMTAGHGAESERGLDPHIWLSPPLVRIQAMTIRDALIAADPAHAADYRRGYARLAQTVNRVDDTLLATLADGDLNNNRFLVFHPAFGYFAAAYGLQQIAVEKEGKEPGPKQLAGVIDTARREKIKVVLVEPQFSRRAAATIAEAIGGRVVAVDPLAEDWPAGMEAIAKAMRRALGGDR